MKSIDEKCDHPSQNNVGKNYPFMALNNVSTTRMEVDIRQKTPSAYNAQTSVNNLGVLRFTFTRFIILAEEGIIFWLEK